MQPIAAARERFEFAMLGVVGAIVSNRKMPDECRETQAGGLVQAVETPGAVRGRTICATTMDMTSRAEAR